MPKIPMKPAAAPVMNRLMKIEKMDKILELIRTEKALMLYFTTTGCNVCKSLQPKIRELLQQNFPGIKFVVINMDEQNELSAQFSIFTVPTILVYFNGTEHFRKSRFIGIRELTTLLSRPYNMLFE